MRSSGLCALAALVFLISGCVKHSVVIKVNRDGSGVIHLRHYQEGKSIPGVETEDLSLPAESELRKLAGRMGEGVSFRSIERKRDANGWEGYEIFFDVKNVNKLVLNEKTLPELLQFQSEEEKKKKTGDNGPFNGATLQALKLQFRDGLLTIEPNFSGPTPAEAEETVDPFAGTAGSGTFANKVALSMASPFMGAARFGVFVQVEPGIRQSNARFVRGKQIGIVNVNFGKLLSQKNAEENLGLLDDLTAASGQPKKAQTVCDLIKGLEVDMTQKITVRTR